MQILRKLYVGAAITSTIFFIRPIPRFLWPSKYQDASRILGIPDLEVNLGTGGRKISFGTLGWAWWLLVLAPGIVADMWLEFWVVFVFSFVSDWLVLWEWYGVRL